MLTTTEDLKQQIQEAIKPESDEPQHTILKVLVANDGKKLTTRITDKINEALGFGLTKTVFGSEQVQIDKSYNMTRLVWGPYSDQKSMMVSYQVKNVVIDTGWVETENPAYFAARVERNESREKISPVDMRKLVTLAETFRVAKWELENMLEFGGAFGADYLTLQKIVGLND